MRNILKQMLAYLVWIVLALIMGVCHMWILLGPKGGVSTGFMHIFDLIYDLALVSIGLITGSVIAFLFILTDIFYLKKKLKNNTKSNFIRFFILIAIAIIVGITHYVLEKVIDVI